MERIVFVTPSLKTGGGNRVFIELANEICKTHEVVIIYPNNSDEYHTFNLSSEVRLKSIGKFGRHRWRKLLNMLRLIRLLNRNYREDVQVITDPLFCVFTFLLRSRRLFRFIQADDYRIFDDGAILGEGILLKIYKRLCLSSYRARIGFIFNSAYVYECFCRDSGRKDIAFRCVHPAINHEIFYAGKEKKEDSRLNICLVARKHPWKGLITFIRMYRNLPVVTRERIGRVILVSHDDLSGFDTEGMKVVKPRSDSDIAEVYRSSDVFISTSWWEGFGLPPLEAMACGCTVITSASGGVNEYASAEENCLMFEPKNVTELKKQLCRLLENETLRKYLSGAGISTSKQFEWGRSAEQFLAIVSKK